MMLRASYMMKPLTYQLKIQNNYILFDPSCQNMINLKFISFGSPRIFQNFTLGRM